MPLPRLPARRDGRVVAVLKKQEGEHTGAPNLKIKTDQFEWARTIATTNFFSFFLFGNGRISRMCIWPRCCCGSTGNSPGQQTNVIVSNTTIATTQKSLAGCRISRTGFNTMTALQVYSSRGKRVHETYAPHVSASTAKIKIAASLSYHTHSRTKNRWIVGRWKRLAELHVCGCPCMKHVWSRRFYIYILHLHPDWLG